MAAAQLNMSQLDQHSVKAMLLQKHISELEKYQQYNGEKADSPTNESGNDSGCENFSDRKSDHDSSTNARSISPISDEEPKMKRSKLIDVVNVDAPVSQSRNMFSIRNLIYSKDTSDSETDQSEDSGNAASNSNGSSPPRPWSPDHEVMRKLKADLSTTLHSFVDTVVSDVCNKVSSNYKESLRNQRKAFHEHRLHLHQEDPMDTVDTRQIIEDAKPMLTAAAAAAQSTISSASPSIASFAAHAQRAQQLQQLTSRHTPSVPTPHQAILSQHLAARATQPQVFQREAPRPLGYPYTALQSSYPYNPMLNSATETYGRRPFLSIDPLTGRIKSEHEMSDEQAMIFGAAHPQEGLTPHHLKKAKLMFFYTRYPSSNVLKTFFPDVKFNRATTSQLIKWFSNFREFFYIQIEKYARHALSEGIENAADLKVTRESELFKALNNHYNKTNEFEVPEEFLDVALMSLREFFVNIKEGRDVDPSWKKAIYKIICKSDIEIPDAFKSATFLTDVAH
ncbi:Oidioi.mRNA.OKI2018_I69.PAR.g10163.t1.cds [Oikopleura dioica]|uniref:Oidioi.mRNA.OKI2018_I69.PAR.g10163.t1.cds n=1 Tax=Oikopleura dioica TaxID=34765 RepID=A0ABN7RUF2_OIKDI|nr:Oidioi.mRNA.OKI2018_I69.PAR.g10163.t1.cds [Oikopleura dioica]